MVHKLLDGVSTNDLLDELINRHEYALFIGNKTEEYNQKGYWYRNKGQRHELLGLAEEMVIVIHEAALCEGQ